MPLPDTPEAARAVDLVLWPDPRLRRKCRPIDLDAPGAREVVAALVERMFEIMRREEGVGLAAPQVGVDARLFVMNVTGEPEDDCAYINPQLSEPSDRADEYEEGCLSLPDIRTPVLRSDRLRLQAVTPEGEPVDVTAEAFVPRVWQHEVDHLDGVLILDKMGPTAKLAARKTLRDLEARFAEANPKAEEREVPKGRKTAKRRKKR
jgi:peptide deformylase